jgi:hypothetical protein
MSHIILAISLLRGGGGLLLRPTYAKTVSILKTQIKDEREIEFKNFYLKL